MNAAGNPNPGNCKPCAVIVKAEPGIEKVYPSISAAGRSIGVSRPHASAMVAGRTGKRSPFRLELA